MLIVARLTPNSRASFLRRQRFNMFCHALYSAVFGFIKNALLAAQFYHTGKWEANIFKNTASKFMVFAFDTTTNTPKTGDAANITAYVSKDYGSVTVLADTSATEMDATNAKGYYLFDAAQGETNGDCLMVSAKSSTANISVIGAPAVIYTRPTTNWLAPATLNRTIVVDASGLADANVVKVGPTGSGTAQTAGDLKATLGTPAGASLAADLAEIEAETDGIAAISTATPLTAAQIATGVWQDATAGDFTTASSIGKSLYTSGVVPGGTNGLFIAGTNAATTITTGLTAHFIGTVDTLTTYTGNTPQTGDSYARLGAPVGASISADIAEIEVETDDISAIKTQTDKLTFTVANVIDANMLRINGVAGSAANLRRTTEAIARCTVTAGASTTSIPTSACTPAGAAADQFKGRIITFDADTTTTALRGQSTDITASSNSATPTFTCTALTTAPVNGDTGSIT